MRKSIRILFAALAGLAVLAGCAAPAPTVTPTTATVAALTPTKAPTATPTKRPLTKVTIATPNTALIFLAAFLGRTLGYWQEEGLDVDWVVAGGGAQALTALVSSSADFSDNAFAPEVIKAISAGQKIKAVSIEQQRGSQILVLNKEIAQQRGVSQKSPLIDRVKALKGLTIATSSAGGANYQLLKALVAQGNLDPERDITAAFIGDNAAIVAAMSQRQIDGFFQSPPPSMQSVANGDAIVLVSVPAGDMPQVGNQAQVGMVAQEQTISGRPEVVDGALRVIWRTERFFSQDVAAAVKALRTLDFYAQIDEQTFRLSIEAVQGSVPKEPLITAEQFNDMVKYYNSTVKAEEQTKITVQQFFDDGPAQRAKKQLGF
ncbi:MAG: ABC transporter substrate-binding protein [Chloroflexi bacterium]|nr:ABC transporter substrate-binding protein [Chloroflexota bacterium]